MRHAFLTAALALLAGPAWAQAEPVQHNPPLNVQIWTRMAEMEANRSGGVDRRPYGSPWGRIWVQKRGYQSNTKYKKPAPCPAPVKPDLDAAALRPTERPKPAPQG